MTWNGDGRRAARTLSKTSSEGNVFPETGEGPQGLSRPLTIFKRKGDGPRLDGGWKRISRDHGDGSGVRHVRRRGHPPDGPRPRAAVLLLLPHLYGGLHHTGEGDPQAPMACPLQPRGRDPPLRRRLRAGRGLVARRDRGTLEPHLLPPRDAGPVRGGVALLPRHLGRD